MSRYPRLTALLLALCSFVAILAGWFGGTGYSGPFSVQKDKTCEWATCEGWFGNAAASPFCQAGCDFEGNLLVFDVCQSKWHESDPDCKLLGPPVWRYECYGACVGDPETGCMLAVNECTDA